MTTPGTKPASVADAIRAAIPMIQDEPAAGDPARQSWLMARMASNHHVVLADLRAALPQAEAYEALVEAAAVAYSALCSPADYNRLHVASDLQHALAKVREASHA